MTLNFISNQIVYPAINIKFIDLADIVWLF